jgi:hypothetical protein
MRAVRVALLLLIVGGCGSTEPGGPANAVSGYGLSIELTSGWWGDVSRPQALGALTLRAGNFSVRQVPTDVGHEAQRTMGPDDILITLVDYGRAHAGWQLPRARLPLAIGRNNMVSFEGFVRPVATDSFVLADHGFQVWVVFGRSTPSDELLAEANHVLATVAIEERRLVLDSLSMRLPVGWDGFAKYVADDIPALYAASTRWPDLGQNLERESLRELFERLPPDGIVVSTVSGPNVDPDARAFALPITLADGYFLADSYEGQPAPRISTQIIFGRVGERYLNAQVFFGRNQPTESMRAEANDVLASLSLTPVTESLG